MAKHHKPVAGSRGFWPKKRASRIYQTIRSYPNVAETVPLGFAGYKAGMTQAIVTDNRKDSPTKGQKIAIPVTVIDCPPLVVCGIRAYKKTSSGPRALATVWSAKLSKDLSRKTRIPKKTDPAHKTPAVEKNIEDISDVRLIVHTKPRDSGIGKKKPELFEMQLGGNDPKAKWEYAKQKLGGELRSEDVFKEGEYLDIRAVDTGKGYQGPVKRFGIRIRPRKHEKKRRHTGNIGAVTPARVLPGKIAMAGQMGFQTRTEYNKRLLKMGAGDLNPEGGWLRYGLVKGNYMVLSGSIPGPRKRFVMIRKALRPNKDTSEQVEISRIIMDSQQGV